jgi:hypothetical protein
MAISLKSVTVRIGRDHSRRRPSNKPNFIFDGHGHNTSRIGIVESQSRQICPGCLFDVARHLYFSFFTGWLGFGPSGFGFGRLEVLR